MAQMASTKAINSKWICYRMMSKISSQNKHLKFKNLRMSVEEIQFIPTSTNTEDIPCIQLKIISTINSCTAPLSHTFNPMPMKMHNFIKAEEVQDYLIWWRLERLKADQATSSIHDKLQSLNHKTIYYIEKYIRQRWTTLINFLLCHFDKFR